MREKLLAIVGPTAVGKTSLSIHIAHQCQGEIISGDSMQVYKGMDIGTAKITEEEMEGIPHHLLNMLEPDQAFSVTQFQQEAKALISGINQAAKLPILVGGTGLYVQAVTHDFQFVEDSTDQSLRDKWQEYLVQNGPEALYQQLLERDAVSAQLIHPHNTRRVIRALEVVESTGKSPGHAQQDWQKVSPYHLVMIGLTMEREKLYERINQRVEQMIAQGLIDEVEYIYQQVGQRETTALQAIGYKEIITYLKGETSRAEAISLLKRNTRRFAKRQLTWFKRMPEIKWFDVTNLEEWPHHLQIITEYVKESLSS